MGDIRPLPGSTLAHGDDRYRMVEVELPGNADAPDADRLYCYKFTRIATMEDPNVRPVDGPAVEFTGLWCDEAANRKAAIEQFHQSLHPVVHIDPRALQALERQREDDAKQ